MALNSKTKTEQPGSRKILVIHGSARANGDTATLVNRLLVDYRTDRVNLSEISVHPFNYSGEYPPDDAFVSIVEKMVASGCILLATPVYWYAMSGHTKTFFDRFTDLITIRKDLGRALKDKNVFLVSVGSDNELPQGFLIPFQRTCDYFEMNFRSSFYLQRDRLSEKLIGAESILSEIEKLQTTV